MNSPFGQGLGEMMRYARIELRSHLWLRRISSKWNPQKTSGWKIDSEGCLILKLPLLISQNLQTNASDELFASSIRFIVANRSAAQR